MTAAAAATGQQPRLSDEEQWSRVTGFISDSIDGARRAEQLHSAAACQLDAVDYAYLALVRELSSVLPEALSEYARKADEEARLEIDRKGNGGFREAVAGQEPPGAMARRDQLPRKRTGSAASAAA